VFKSINETFEIIIVNDGGNADTWKQIEEVYKKLNCKISVVRLSKNYGQHNATLCGIGNSVGEIIITIDDDLQVRPIEILKLIEEYRSETPDVIYGVFKRKKNSIIKSLGSTYIKKVSKFFMDSPGEGSSFRLFKRSLATKIIEHSQSFVYIDELLLWYTDNISFVEVEHEHRKNQKSRYSILKLLFMSFNITTNYTALPLKVITYLGMSSSIISLLLGGYFVYRKIVKNVPAGYTSVIVAVLFSASLIMFSLGVLGQYIFKLYQAQNKKPTYSIKKKLAK
jgi:undecaprenyl-phosphate 4-deoxy-4-formamido-L-arabinose transferase